MSNKPEKVTSTVSTIVVLGGQNVHIQNSLEKKITATQDPKFVSMDLQKQNIEMIVDVIKSAASAFSKKAVSDDDDS